MCTLRLFIIVARASASSSQKGNTYLHRVYRQVFQEQYFSFCLQNSLFFAHLRSAVNIQKGLRGMRDRKSVKRAQIEADKERRYTELSLTVEELLGSIPMLCKVPPHVRRLLSKNVVWRNFLEDDVVVHEGECADSMYVFIHGTAKVLRGPERKEVMRFMAGSFFGENSLTQVGETRHASVVAANTVTCIEIRRDVYQQCLQGDGPMINHGKGGPNLDHIDVTY